MNPNNHGVLVGRMARDAQLLATNSDGSKRYSLTIAVENNFRNRAGERTAEFVSVEKFVGAGKSEGIIPQLRKGDEVSVAFTVRNNNYVDAQGKQVYGIKLECVDMPSLRGKYYPKDGAATEPAAEPATEPTVEPAV